jgi:succinate dehydrogenase / fumarate reductase cytochrome b subunit
MSRPSSRSFLFGRLHSLAGILPLGLFLLEHLYSNAVAIKGKDAYDNHITTLLGIPFLTVIEVVFIAIPLIYHAAYGIYIGVLAKNNPYRYAYTRNWMFVMQRLSGVLTLVFVLYHLWQFRLSSLIFGTTINFDIVHQQLANPFIFTFYVLGVVSTTFHFSNGLWTAMITWGITSGDKAQRVSSVVRYALFLILTGVGVGSLISFV